ncbi:MAG TPA: alcohol dehydrogenase catalytic domain-containing protein [bacterium]|nr:alcohol dehydrogenase catalytic domain-containing protein [bacterium]
MKAVYLAGKKKIVIEDIPGPEIKKDTDVLVRVKSVGICGSDIHYYLEGRIGDQVVGDSIILGHEAAGEVVDTGKAVNKVKKGDKVAIEPGISCGMCEQCFKGKPNLCPHVLFFGTPPVDGALREFVVMPQTHLIPLPAEIDYNEGILSEPLAIGLYGVKLSGMSLGDEVAITGAGPIGLSVLFSVKTAGAKKIFVSDLYKPRLDMAVKLGADRVVLASEENITDVVRRETGGRGVDIGYEAAGKAETFKQSAEVARIGGKTVIYGIPADNRIEFDASVVRRKELQIINVRRSAHMSELALELIAQRKLPFSSLVTHTFPLERVEEALEMVAEYKDGVVKAVVEL